MSHLPEKILSHLLPFCDYLETKYRIKINRDIIDDIDTQSAIATINKATIDSKYLLSLFDSWHFYWKDKMFTSEKIKIEIDYFNEKNRNYRLTLSSTEFIDKSLYQTITIRSLLSLKDNIYNITMETIYKITLDKTIHHHKNVDGVTQVYIYNELIYIPRGDYDKKIEKRFNFKIVDKLSIPKYTEYLEPLTISKYVEPQTLEKQIFTCTYELLKYFPFDIASMIIDCISLTIL